MCARTHRAGGEEVAGLRVLQLDRAHFALANYSAPPCPQVVAVPVCCPMSLARLTRRDLVHLPGQTTALSLAWRCDSGGWGGDRAHGFQRQRRAPARSPPRLIPHQRDPPSCGLSATADPATPVSGKRSRPARQHSRIQTRCLCTPRRHLEAPVRAFQRRSTRLSVSRRLGSSRCLPAVGVAYCMSRVGEFLFIDRRRL